MRPSSLSTETTTTSLPKPPYLDSTRTPKKRSQPDATSVSSRSLQLGLVLVDTVLVAGAGQARTVGAVGAVDQVLSIKIDVSNRKGNGNMSRGDGSMPTWNAMSTSHHARSLHMESWCCWWIKQKEGLGSPCSQCSCWSRCSPVATVSVARLRSTSFWWHPRRCCSCCCSCPVGCIHCLAGGGRECQSVNGSFMSFVLRRRKCWARGGLQLLLFLQL